MAQTIILLSLSEIADMLIGKEITLPVRDNIHDNPVIIRAVFPASTEKSSVGETTSSNQLSEQQIRNAGKESKPPKQTVWPPKQTVHSRPECIFNYCPRSEACKDECQSPSGNKT